jgi:uncharacterized protein
VAYLTFLLLNLANEPDLRSWLSLPGRVSLVAMRRYY